MVTARRTQNWVAAAMLLMVLGAGTGAARAETAHHFVPNNINYWYDSAHWTTNFGPAFRDTILGISYMVPCTEQFALCFHSGADPLPCTLTKNGTYANCTCTVATSTSYVLITAILNYNVYLDTLETCGADGSQCTTPDTAPVCADLTKGKLIPGANVISTYDSDSRAEILAAIAAGSDSITACNGPYAACMTAPCKMKKSGDAVCTCPVFHGRFQLLGTTNTCSLGGSLVPSASYIPVLDSQLPN
jgi:hypothetical protein